MSDMMAYFRTVAPVEETTSLSYLGFLVLVFPLGIIPYLYYKMRKKCPCSGAKVIVWAIIFC